ncbi:hypothetical protein ACFVDQ_42880 [Streptomyces sp. NPDC057684]|uniref:hypothetical protein n=1 Tax=unclassified Streptomyces TaxID=2593676 RepID=UPI00367B260A
MSEQAPGPVVGSAVPRRHEAATVDALAVDYRRIVALLHGREGPASRHPFHQSRRRADHGYSERILSVHGRGEAFRVAGEPLNCWDGHADLETDALADALTRITAIRPVSAWDVRLSVGGAAALGGVQTQGGLGNEGRGDAGAFLAAG